MALPRTRKGKVAVKDLKVNRSRPATRSFYKWDPGGPYRGPFFVPSLLFLLGPGWVWIRQELLEQCQGAVVVPPQHSKLTSKKKEFPFILLHFEDTLKKLVLFTKRRPPKKTKHAGLAVLWPQKRGKTLAGRVSGQNGKWGLIEGLQENV